MNRVAQPSFRAWLKALKYICSITSLLPYNHTITSTTCECMLSFSNARTSFALWTYILGYCVMVLRYIQDLFHCPRCRLQAHESTAQCSSMETRSQISESSPNRPAIQLPHHSLNIFSEKSCTSSLKDNPSNSGHTIEFIFERSIISFLCHSRHRSSACRIEDPPPVQTQNAKPRNFALEMNVQYIDMVATMIRIEIGRRRLYMVWTILALSFLPSRQHRSFDLCWYDIGVYCTYSVDCTVRLRLGGLGFQQCAR